MRYVEKDKDGVEIEIGPFGVAHFNDTPYLEWFHNPKVTEFNSHGLFPYTEKKKHGFLADIEAGDRIVWAIYRAGFFIGVCSLQSINWINRSCEFAIVIGATKVWGKGIARACLRMLCAHAFERMGMNRVWSGTSELNIGMRKVFETSGFYLEGRFREAQFLKGAYRDIIEYGLLKYEWDLQKEAK